MTGTCRWCGVVLEPTPGRRPDRVFCSTSHREKYRRATAAANLAELVERLGPHVDESGIFIYKELVDHLAGRLNQSV